MTSWTRSARSEALVILMDLVKLVDPASSGRWTRGLRQDPGPGQLREVGHQATGKNLDPGQRREVVGPREPRGPWTAPGWCP